VSLLSFSRLSPRGVLSLYWTDSPRKLPGSVFSGNFPLQPAAAPFLRTQREDYIIPQFQLQGFFCRTGSIFAAFLFHRVFLTAATIKHRSTRLFGGVLPIITETDKHVN